MAKWLAYCKIKVKYQFKTEDIIISVLILHAMALVLKI